MSLRVASPVVTACTSSSTPPGTEESAGHSAIVTAPPSAQPLRVGPGFIRAGFHATGQGLGEHQRRGGLEFAAEQAGGASCLEPQRPPVLVTDVDFGEFHLALGFLAPPRAARHDLPAAW